jgi:hypothetical protein
MSKFLSILLSIILFTSQAFSNPLGSYSFVTEAKEFSNTNIQNSNKSEMIFSIDKRYTFGGYVIKDNELYIALSIDGGNGWGLKNIYKYENKHLIKMELNEDEIESYWNDKTSVERYSFENNKIVINDTACIKFEPISLDHWLRIVLVENGVRKEQKDYVCILSEVGGYLYFDKKI